MGQIVALDQNMINMIAAGEVIERPASVVKELMENSIDAGATQITVSVEDGGRKLISITDNGCGMDAEDMSKAFDPHTTSKIKSSADLLAISTLGFRGEALASIGSVANVRVVSKTTDSLQANCIQIDCGDKSQVSPCSADAGTCIKVRDLFYKLPARRKFLRTANTEMGHISEQFARIALGCSPLLESATKDEEKTFKQALSLILINNGRELYRLSNTLSLEERIKCLFPSLSDDPTQDFLRSHNKEKGIEIVALLGKPIISRTSNKFQYTFLNGRFIRDKFISHAIKEAYRGLLEPNRFPAVFLFIRMNGEDFDVNVHPTKTEVRFFNSNLVHSQILACLREKLLGTDLDVPARLPTFAGHTCVSDITSESPPRGEKIADAMAEFFKHHKPSHIQRNFGFRVEERAQSQPRISSPPIAEPYIPPTDYQRPTPPRRFMQIHDSFIVSQTEDGFVIIDQHALHERIIYETLRKRVESEGLESQKLLIPANVELSKSQIATIESHADLIEKLGIELVPFGPNTMAVQSFPTILAKADPIDFIQDMLDLLESNETGPKGEGLLDDILNMAACKAAIKAGQKLSDSEIENLLANIESTDCISRCPHGRPTTIKFSIADLEKQFKRT